MNWLLIVVIVILILFGIKGRRDGFIRTVFSIFSVLIALVIASTMSPYVSRTLQNNEKLMERIVGGIQDALMTEERDKGDKTEQEEIITGLKLPQSLKEALSDNNNSEVYKALAAKSFSEYASRYLAVVILNAASFLLTYIITSILLAFIVRALDLISKLPIINGLNKTAGLLIGILNGLIALWILCIVLTMFSTTEIGGNIYNCINDSRILSSIYNNNLLLRFITDLAKALF